MDNQIPFLQSAPTFDSEWYSSNLIASSAVFNEEKLNGNFNTTNVNVNSATSHQYSSSMSPRKKYLENIENCSTKFMPESVSLTFREEPFSHIPYKYMQLNDEKQQTYQTTIPSLSLNPAIAKANSNNNHENNINTNVTTPMITQQPTSQAPHFLSSSTSFTSLQTYPQQHQQSTESAVPSSHSTQNKKRNIQTRQLKRTNSESQIIGLPPTAFFPHQKKKKSTSYANLLHRRMDNVQRVGHPENFVENELQQHEHVPMIAAAAEPVFISNSTEGHWNSILGLEVMEKTPHQIDRIDSSNIISYINDYNKNLHVQRQNDDKTLMPNCSSGNKDYTNSNNSCVYNSRASVSGVLIPSNPVKKEDEPIYPKQEDRNMETNRFDPSQLHPSHLIDYNSMTLPTNTFSSFRQTGMGSIGNVVQQGMYSNHSIQTSLLPPPLGPTPNTVSKPLQLHLQQTNIQNCQQQSYSHPESTNSTAIEIQKITSQQYNKPRSKNEHGFPIFTSSHLSSANAKFSSICPSPCPSSTNSATKNMTLNMRDMVLTGHVPDEKGRKYECSLCHKRFTRPSTLRTHMNSHTGERPFGCTAPGCGWRFTVLSNLRRHMRVCPALKKEANNVEENAKSNNGSMVVAQPVSFNVQTNGAPTQAHFVAHQLSVQHLPPSSLHH